MAVDLTGGIYVVGTANGHGMVRYSPDEGSNWITRDDFVHPPESAWETDNYFNAVTVDHAGTVFVGGCGGGHWIVRRSTDRGVTWETVDDYYTPMTGPEIPGTNGRVFSLSSDHEGRVYALGSMHITGPTYNRWWIRGSGPSGTNWDTRLVLFSAWASAAQITCAGEDVYAAGAVNGEPYAVGLIVRSSDHGVTWTTNYERVQDLHYAITADSAANLYSAGTSYSSTSFVFQVRKAAPGGTHWTTLDAISYGDSDDGLSPKSIALDAAGNVSVAGYFLDHWVIEGTNGTTSGADQYWFARQYLAATRQWSTTDLFSYSTNREDHALGTVITPSGCAFVVGYGTSDSGQRHWLVRKRIIPLQLRVARAGSYGVVSWSAAYANWILEWTDCPGVTSSWHPIAGPVGDTNGLSTITFEVTPGLRFFRLKSTAGP